MKTNKLLLLTLCLSGVFAACQKAEALEVFTTAMDTDLRLTVTGQPTFRKGSQPTENEISIFINPEVRFQTMLGFGGAITDASAEVYAKLTPAGKDELINAYFDTEGLDYSLARTISRQQYSFRPRTYFPFDAQARPR